MASEQRNSERAWIVYPDGRRFGPFESVDLAIQVRVYVERVERREDLAIKRQSELAEEPFIGGSRS